MGSNCLTGEFVASLVTKQPCKKCFVLCALHPNTCCCYLIEFSLFHYIHFSIHISDNNIENYFDKKFVQIMFIKVILISSIPLTKNQLFRPRQLTNFCESNISPHVYIKPSYYSLEEKTTLLIIVKCKFDFPFYCVQKFVYLRAIS